MGSVWELWGFPGTFFDFVIANGLSSIHKHLNVLTAAHVSLSGAVLQQLDGIARLEVINNDTSIIVCWYIVIRFILLTVAV